MLHPDTMICLDNNTTCFLHQLKEILPCYHSTYIDPISDCTKHVYEPYGIDHPNPILPNGTPMSVLQIIEVDGEFDWFEIDVPSLSQHVYVTRDELLLCKRIAGSIGLGWLELNYAAIPLTISDVRKAGKQEILCYPDGITYPGIWTRFNIRRAKLDSEPKVAYQLVTDTGILIGNGITLFTMNRANHTHWITRKNLTCLPDQMKAES